MELWKDIPGYEGLYQASDQGKIKSLGGKKIGKGIGWKTEEKIMSPSVSKSGYFSVCLRKYGKIKGYRVGRLILETFVGKSTLQCNHINGIKSDNSIENLEWVDGFENQRHSIRIGLRIQPSGEKCYNHKLKKCQADMIKYISKNLTVEKGFWSKVSKSLDISPNTISNVIYGRTWK